jgi:hypothetical protein
VTDSLFLHLYRPASVDVEQEEPVSRELTAQRQHRNNREEEVGADHVARVEVVDEEVVVVRGREQTVRQKRAMGCLQMTSNMAQTDLIKKKMRMMSQILILLYLLGQSLAAISLNLHNSSQQYQVQLAVRRRRDHIEEIQSRRCAKHVIEVIALQTIKWYFATVVVAHIISIAMIHQ